MNGKVWSVVNTKSDSTIDRLIDIQIPNEVMDALYIPIDSKVFISDGGNFTAKLKLDNSEGGRELNLGFKVNGSAEPFTLNPRLSSLPPSELSNLSLAVKFPPSLMKTFESIGIYNASITSFGI